MKNLNKEEKEALDTVQNLVYYGFDGLLFKSQRRLLQHLINYVKNHYKS